MPGSPDLSEFDEYVQRDQRKACKVGSIRDQLDEQARAQLDAALVAGYSNKAILGWLEARGFGPPMSLNSAVSSHKHGTCNCA